MARRATTDTIIIYSIFVRDVIITNHSTKASPIEIENVFDVNKLTAFDISY